jgi:predicted nucleic acid-binding protein
MKYTVIMEDKTIFLDTNIIIFSSFTASQFHQRALDKINFLQSEGYVFCISRQVIREYLVVKSKLLHAENKYDSKAIAVEIRDFE